MDIVMNNRFVKFFTLLLITVFSFSLQGMHQGQATAETKGTAHDGGKKAAAPAEKEPAAPAPEAKRVAVPDAPCLVCKTLASAHSADEQEKHSALMAGITYFKIALLNKPLFETLAELEKQRACFPKIKFRGQEAPNFLGLFNEMKVASSDVVQQQWIHMSKGASQEGPSFYQEHEKIFNEVPPSDVARQGEKLAWLMLYGATWYNTERRIRFLNDPQKTNGADWFKKLDLGQYVSDIEKRPLLHLIEASSDNRQLNNVLTSLDLQVKFIRGNLNSWATWNRGLTMDQALNLIQRREIMPRKKATINQILGILHAIKFTIPPYPV